MYEIPSRKSYKIQDRVSFCLGNEVSLSYAARRLSLRVRELVRQTCERFEIQIIRGVVSKDHVHILVSAPPNISPSDIMRRIKGRVSRKIFEEFPHVKKRYLAQGHL